MTAHQQSGATVYDLHGRAGIYVARAAGGHIVEPIYDVEDDDEPRYGNAETWSEAFAKPPTERLHAEVAAIEQKLIAAHLQLEDVRAARRQQDAEHAARLERLKKHAHLSRIDDYVEGRITHFVVQSRYSDAITIKTFEELAKQGDRRGRMPMLVLYGDPYSDWERRMRTSEWCLMSDGPESGVMPCSSFEEATAKAQVEVDKTFNDWRKDPKSNYGHSKLVSMARSALASGLQVPPDVMVEVERRERAHADSVVERCKTELARAQQALDEAQSRLAATTGACAS